MDNNSSTPPALDVLLPVIGSAGDLNPMLAFAAALKQRGHNVSIAANEVFADEIRLQGVGFVAMGSPNEMAGTVADPRLWHKTKAFECIAERMIVPNISRLYEIIHTHKTRKTVVVASGVCLGARVAQEKLRVPLVTVHLQPALLRSMVDSGHQGRIPMGPGMPRWFKKAIFSLVDMTWVDKFVGKPFNGFRLKQGLRPVNNVFAGYLHSPQLVIGFFPEWFAAIQPDWPANTFLTGFILHDSVADMDDLVRAKQFIADGPAPVLFTAGTAAATMQSFFHESVEACRIGDFRGLLISAHPAQLPHDLPPAVKAFCALPFSRIMPACSAIVHAGGIGTCAQSIRAGVPQLIIPHAHDQPDNAARIQKLGLGARLYPEQYRAAKAAKMLHQIRQSPAIAEACREYSGKIDSVEALEKACRLIEGLGVGAETVVSATEWAPSA
jgi:rhamnosyltransferase subunit B